MTRSIFFALTNNLTEVIFYWNRWKGSANPPSPCDYSRERTAEAFKLDSWRALLSGNGGPREERLSRPSSGLLIKVAPEMAAIRMGKVKATFPIDVQAPALEWRLMPRYEAFPETGPMSGLAEIKAPI